MTTLIAVTTRRIAATVAVVGTLLTVGGTLTLAEHYAHTETGARTLVQGTSAPTLVQASSVRKLA